MATSSFDAIFSQKPPASAPPASAPGEAQAGGSSFDNLFAGVSSQSSTAKDVFSSSSGLTPTHFYDPQTKSISPVASSPVSVPTTFGGSSFDSIFKSEAIQNSPSFALSDAERKESAPGRDTTQNDDEPWYAKTWSWMNRPLFDAHQFGVRTGAGTVERGIESGVEDLISGFTSPLSIALTLGTLGGGAVLSGASAGLRAVGIAAEDAPIVARGIKTLMDAGFTAQAVEGFVTQSPQFLDALKDGDYESAARLGTNMVATGALAGLGGRKVFEDASNISRELSGRGGNTAESMAMAKKHAGILDEDRAVAASNALKFAAELREQLKAAGADDEIRQGAIRKYIAAGGDVKLLKDMHDTLAGTLRTREVTPEEAAGPDFKKWFGKSRAVDSTGKPATFFLTDSANGTNKLGPTLTTSGDPADAHYVKIEKPKDFGEVSNLTKFVESSGGEEKAKASLRSSGFDSIIYKAEDGKSAIIALDDKNIRPAAAHEGTVNRLWDKDFVYRAVDPKTGEVIRNAGFFPQKPGTEVFFDSPEKALDKAVLTPGTTKADLHVFAVPRAEVEADTAAIAARDAAKLKAAEEFKSKPKTPMTDALTGKQVREAASAKETVGNRYPSHQVVIDENGEPTGQVIPLRSDSPYSLTTSREPFEAKYTPEEKQKLLDQYKAAQNLTPAEKGIAERLRNHYDAQFDKAYDGGLIREAIKNYHPQAWAKDNPGVLESLFGIKIRPTDNPAYAELRHATDNGKFDTNIVAAKHRAYRTEFNGEMAGEKPLTNDLAKHAADYQFKLDRAIAARKFLDNLRASGAKSSDGRPLVVMSGSGRVVGVESGNPALLVNPSTPKAINIKNEIVQGWAKEVDPHSGQSKFQMLLDSGKIEKLPWTREIVDEASGGKKLVPAYAWSTDGYQHVDHPSMRDWSYIGQDTAGKPAILKSEMRVHPEAADYVRQTVGAEKSVFRTNPYLRTLMAAQREAKGALLSFSPFHAVQEFLRAGMVGINPLDIKDVDLESNPKLRLGVRNGLNLMRDYKHEDMFSEGNASHSKIAGKIPGLGWLNGEITKFIFEKQIPAYKARAFQSLYERFQEKMPGASADEIAKAAASYTNDAFGGLDWKNLGFSTTAQDAAKSFALAPDWLLSEIRMMGRTAGMMGKPAATIARQDMLRISAYLFATARVMNMLSTGKPHPEAPFGIVIPSKDGGDDKVYSLRAMPTDIIHMMTSPREFALGRVNPLVVRPTFEALTGRDSFGRKVTGAQQVSDFTKNIIPIGIQGLIRGSQGGNGLSEGDQVVKALGGTAYRYKTEASKLAQELASDHMPQGPVSPEQLRKHQRNIELEDQLRNGEILPGQIHRLMPAREAQEVIQNSKLSPLQSRFVRLPFDEKLKVWEIATPSERDQLHAMLWKARVTYIKSHPPAQRENDYVWIHAKKVFGDLN